MKVKGRVVITVIALAVFLLALFLISQYLIWKNNYRGRIYPGIKIGDLDLSGRTAEEATMIISAQTEKIKNAGMIFRYNQKTAILATDAVSFDSDLSYPALSFEIDAIVKEALGENIEHSFGHYLLFRFSPESAKKIKAIYSLSEDKVSTFLQENFSDLNIYPENAYFSLSENAALKNNPEKLGKEIDYTAALAEARTNLDDLKNEPIVIKTHSEYPFVKQENLLGLEGEVQKIIGRGSLSLVLEKIAGATTTKYWEVRPEKLITWIGAQKINDQIVLSLDQKKIKEYLGTVIAPAVDQAAVQPRFEMKNGRVTSWQTGKNGYQIDQEITAAKITEEFLNGQNKINLVIKEVPGENLTANNNFKIKEIIGTGHSNFAGSPVNRRHNISVGAASLHGLLITPGEEFSLIKTLGEINAATGYRTELVIKGDKTVPEFGGGLCQIGTTVFRTALSTGLPITMRQNHSYRVSYYEPAGTDATIYDPAPDLRFINDTGNYILIQARIEKNDLYFDFWGVSDGRVATTTYPVIYNIVKPEPTKIIESDSLKPGEKKCTESSHNGADAYFDYKVIYPAGATTTPIQERRFKSHYVPWRAVCLVGKTASSTPIIVGATSTAPVSTATSSATTNN